MSQAIRCDFCGGLCRPCLGDAGCDCGSGFQLCFQHRKNFFDGLFSRSAWIEVDICGKCACLIRRGIPTKSQIEDAAEDER